ncbi:hypothetical protein ACVWZK_000159 [Bradyrhizobium sp. GM0.4]
MKARKAGVISAAAARSAQLICDLAGRVAGPPLNAAESHDPNRIGVLA